MAGQLYHDTTESYLYGGWAVVRSSQARTCTEDRKWDAGMR
jgi:hypothetical protein